MRFLFILIAYVFVEIALFSTIGGAIGTVPVLVLVALGFFVGRYFIARSGQNAQNWMRDAQSGRAPVDMSGQIGMLIGGILIILPGFFTDFLGLALIFPPTRKLVTKLIGISMPKAQFTQANAQPTEPGTIEGEVIESDRKP